MLHNPKGGYLDNKLKYIRRKEPQSNTNESDSDEECGSGEMGNNIDKQISDLAKLRSIVVNSQNMEAIKSILISTSQYRTNLLNDKQIDLKKEFPFFFVSTELVS